MRSFSATLATLFLSVSAQQSVLDNFQCLSDPKVIRYNNSDAIPDLPLVRVMMCGYSSQCALNMVAYLFMKEKLGMNVTFHPTLDYDNIWSGDLWDNWENNAYPRLYFDWLYQDEMDLNFEFWPTQLVRTSYSGEITFDGKTEYVLSGKIDFGGFVGAYGEESIWLPKYYVDSNPSSIIPQEIRDNAIFRQELIDASLNGTTNYYAEYGWFGQNSTAFDNTTDTTKPIVWGSSPGYFMSQYANDLKNNAVEGGMDVKFVTTGSEGRLATLVQDLYSQRVPFLANIYTIDDNFGILGNASSGELQEFEKVAFARNPDQSLYDPCFLAKECQYPIGPIMKAANPLLESRFPEAHEYFNNFQIGTRQLNEIVSKYWQITDNSIGNTEKWLTAACEWLKSNDSAAQETWNNDAWLIDVIRFDCLDGCGVAADNGQEFGGECNYYTGTCECHYDELFPDLHCQGSCPGLLGPLLNSTGDGYYFEWCSGHGSCDTITRQCACDQAYGGEGCEIAYDQYSLAVGLQVVIILLSAILAIVCIACIVWLRMSAEYKTVKALSVDMTTIMTVGLLMIVCSNVALTQTVSSATCIAWQWLFGLGGILSIMSPLLKAYRVSRVFHGGKMLRAVKITDKMLMAMLIKFALFEVLICIAYSVLHEISGGSVKFYNGDELRVEDKCNDNSLTGYISMGSYAYFFIMLCALTKYSYGTRRALSVFKESTCAYFSSFLSLLCTLIVMVFYMATQDPTFRTTIQSFAIILVVSAVLALFYGTRIYTFYNEPENRNVTDVRAATHTSTASHSVMKPGPSAQA